jgi:curved DNA-binding protein CbpA
MKTLYDLLGIRPSVDAEALRAAFRKAAKANHPDLHAGDPYAAMRFRQIAEAYEILRDTERRATYDRLLQFERKRVVRRLKGKGTASYLIRRIAFDAVAAVGLAIVLAGGYTIYAHISTTPAEVLAVTGGRGSARFAVIQPAGSVTMNKPGEHSDEPERNAGPDMMVPNAAASVATHAPPSESTPGPVPGAAALNAEVANVTNDSAVTMDRADPNSAVERPDQTARTEKLDQDNAQLVKVLSSSGQSDNGGGKSFAGDKREMKRNETHDINADDAKISDAKLPETRIPPKARIAVKRQTTGHTTFEQASLENRNACSGSCLRDVPPLFGVGF